MTRDQKIEFFKRFFSIPINAESPISQEILTMFEEYADVETLADIEMRYNFLRNCYDQLYTVYQASLTQFKNGEIEEEDLDDIKVNLDDIQDEMDELEKKMNLL